MGMCVLLLTHTHRAEKFNYFLALIAILCAMHEVAERGREKVGGKGLVVLYYYIGFLHQHILPGLEYSNKVEATNHTTGMSSGNANNTIL
jgi:hypothetical protein